MDRPDQPTTVVLDAMGVLYRHGNVVKNLLAPYLRSKGCQESPATILATYHACTRGEIKTAELWDILGVPDTASDAEYCTAHETTPGLIPLLDHLTSAGLTLACLTNDTAEWSAILRRRFGLDRYIKHWYVSADLGVRKPDPQAYNAVLHDLNADPSTILFIDDRGPNLLPAQALGLQTALFTSDDTDKHPIPPNTPVLHTMPDLARLATPPSPPPR
ncbi:HAD family hydrolase [Kribbella sp. CA-294648]|uniref:HAD family hydrolase n=1 Tax=Kribbella sp. CA-294648 TaxID=3239948 RepID=UPI003D9337F9